MFDATKLLEDVQEHLLLFLPELMLCAGIITFLILRLFKALDRAHMGFAALAFALSALGVAWFGWQETIPPATSDGSTRTGISTSPTGAPRASRPDRG